MTQMSSNTNDFNKILRYYRTFDIVVAETFFQSTRINLNSHLQVPF